MNIDKKSKILIYIFFLVVFIFISITFYRYVIQKDYIIIAQVECDPTFESCFYLPCEGDDCSEEIDYYKKINKKVFNLESCNPEISICNPFVCEEGEKDCEIIFCSIDTVSDGEECSTN